MMNEIVRRLLMMVGIIGIGTILVLSNASLIITISASVLFGFILTIGLGLLKIDDIRNLTIKKNKNSDSSNKNTNPVDVNDAKDGKNSKTPLSKRIFPHFQKGTKKDVLEKDKKEPKTKNRISAGLSGAIGSFKSTISKTRDTKHTEKIDSILNTTIEESINPSSDTEISEDQSFDTDSFDDEDFGSLDSLEIEGEETGINFDIDMPGEISPGDSQESGALDLDNEINSILLSSGEISDESDSEFVFQDISGGLDEDAFTSMPNPEGDIQSSEMTDSLKELENISEFGENNFGDDDFSNLETINLDELDSDDLLLETEEIIIEEEEEIDDIDILPDGNDTVLDEITPEKKSLGLGDEKSLFAGTDFGNSEIESPITFSGKNEYDDILSVLETDIKKTKTGTEPSLVRELKDVHVDSNSLVEELEAVLHSMGGKTGIPKNNSNRGEE